MVLFYWLYQFEGTDLVALRPDEGCLPFQTLSTHGCNSTAGGYFADVRDHIIYGGIILYTISKVLTWEYWNADQLLRATMPQLTEITSSFESIGKCYLLYVGGVLKEGERGGGATYFELEQYIWLSLMSIFISPCLGHIAHLNLRDKQLPFKSLIGQIILDKNKHIKTVVNKLSSIVRQPLSFVFSPPPPLPCM